MTQRPIRRDLDAAVGENFRRTRNLERLHHGPWIYVGSGTLLPDGLTSPDFENGWENIGGGLQEMRFRWLRNGGLEIQGSITGGTAASTIFTLPNDPLYLPDDGELRRPASDGNGQFIVYRILTTGEVMFGV